jgi:hypothetical protein
MQQRRYVLYLGIMALASPLVANPLLAQDTRVSITVIDEKNNGVASVVNLKYQGNRIRFGATNKIGQIHRAHRCELGQTFQADPEDRGAYFSSEERDCGEKVILHVIGRQTPYGAALDMSTVPIGYAVSDRWKYVVVSKGVSNDALQASPGTLPQGCELIVNTKVIPELYAIDRDAKWVKVAHAVETRKSEVKYVYNRPCEQVGATEAKAKSWKAVQGEMEKANFIIDVGLKEAITKFEIVH